MNAGGGALLLGLLLAAALPQRAHAQQPPAGHAYTLSVRLDPDAQRLDGTAQIRFRNHSQRPLGELVFHLYPNAFASNRTVFMREGGASIRGGRLRRTGGIDLHALTLADGTDLLATAERELVLRDRTQLRVALPAPLAPGRGLELRVRFSVRLPWLLARMGSAGSFFMIAQFFPKLARLEPDGSFASFPYHGLGEFYADFADYELTVDVPERFVVAAPGQRVEQRAAAGGRRIERYRLPHALDIAFAADPHLRRVSAAAGSVQIDGYAPAGQLDLAARQVALLQAGLVQLSARLGPYPQSRLVLVLPPPAAVGAAGMEYPGLITGWTAGAFTPLNPTAGVLHDVVTTHELAHQWFPMLVATNEVESPVLDEGLAEWIGLDLVRQRFAGRAFAQRWLGLPVDPFDAAQVAFAGAGKVPSSLLPAHGYEPAQLGPAVYLRPALALETVARSWGRARLWTALGRYARAHRFGHPGRANLLRAFDAVYYPGFGAQVLTPALAGESFATRLTRAGGALSAQRDGGSALPSSVEVRYAGAPPSRTRWPAGTREHSVPLDRTRNALGASLDPDHHNLLDSRRGDDQLRLSAAAPQPPLLARLLVAVQALLGVLGP